MLISWRETPSQAEKGFPCFIGCKESGGQGGGVLGGSGGDGDAEAEGFAILKVRLNGTRWRDQRIY